MNDLLSQAGSLLAGLGVPWAICGGFALELFLGRGVRTHGDIDVCVFEDGRAAIQEYMLRAGWTLYEFRGQGRVRPLSESVPGEPGRNFLCLREPCELIDFYPCEEEGMLLHLFHHTGIKKLNYLDFLFNTMENGALVIDRERGVARPLAKAFLRAEGVPFLCPEAVLLFKAARAEEPDGRIDFRETAPALRPEQRAWLREGLAALYPRGHAWINEL